MSTESTLAALGEHLEALPLVDHHVHSAVTHDLERAEFESYITEAPEGFADGITQFDSQVGFGIRRWCAPVLGLDPFASAEQYLARRRELGGTEATRMLLRASGVSRHLIDTGFKADTLATNERFGELAGSRVDEIVRLETVAETLALTGAVDGAAFPGAYRAALVEATRTAVGVKSIVAYRHGFHFAPERPTDAAVADAAGRWLDQVAQTGVARIVDPLLLGFLLWCGVDRGLPIQLHTGYGDPDLDLRLADPLLLRGFIERAAAVAATPIVLLHSYPFQRHCGFLAQVYRTVYFDVGLAINYTGARSRAVVAESLELAPFSKVLFSSDAWGPAELHHLGAVLWRRSTAAVLGGFVDSGEWSLVEAQRVATMIGVDNALALYGSGSAA